ncbi:MAG: HNH endonuclease [Psychroserpens sp.]|uniref:HNH endonuclease n=1 Tax=Psychroserpens sp. TaxID=2020870 RepID=UPI003C746A7C
MIRNEWNEKWKVLSLDDKISEEQKFEISNYGRLKYYKDGKETLVKVTYINGYQNLPLRQKRNGKLTSRYVHKLVAQHFLEQNDGIYVIHLNYDKTDNHVKNLKWATKREKEIHQFSNPEFKNRVRTIPSNAKLTETKVKLIKRKINDPNRRTRMKILAKRFGVSTMQLYRIKSGENWSHVTE